MFQKANSSTGKFLSISTFSSLSRSMVLVSLDFTRHSPKRRRMLFIIILISLWSYGGASHKLWRTFSVSIQTLCRRTTSDEEKFRWKFNKMYHYPGGVVLKNVYKMWRECGMLHSHITFSLCAITSNDIDIGMWGVECGGGGTFSIEWQFHFTSSRMLSLQLQAILIQNLVIIVLFRFFFHTRRFVYSSLSVLQELNGHRWSSRKMVEIFPSATWRFI